MMKDNTAEIWRCLKCETLNRGTRCAVCGEEYKNISLYEQLEIKNDSTAPAENRTAEGIKKVPEYERLHGTDKRPFLKPNVTNDAAAGHEDTASAARSGSGGLYTLSRSYRMKTFDDIEDNKEVLSKEFLKLREISENYRMRSLEELEG